MCADKGRHPVSESYSPGSASPAASTTSTVDTSLREDNSAVVAASESRQGVTITRRGHVKSRLGCFSCKRRRVKCDEVRPCCTSCRRLGLRCEYPAQATWTLTTPGSPASSAPQLPLSGLALEDLRFYHQFLTVGHPTLPLQGGAVWSQAAAMSHQFDFLAHAILGLGAAHVTQNNPGVDYTPSALQHRLTAIKRVNQEFDKPKRTTREADALMAAVLCLIAQSSLFDNSDSMIEYLTMSRGANLVLNQLLPNIGESIFCDIHIDAHLDKIRDMTSEQPMDLELLGHFQDSVLALMTLCSGPNEMKYIDCLIRCSTALRISGTNAWREFITLWMMPTLLSNQDFVDFVAPNNHGARLLIVHGFLIEYILGHSCISPDKAPSCGGRKNVIISWTRNTAAALPAELQGYASWMLQYCQVLEKQDARYLMSP